MFSSVRVAMLTWCLGFSMMTSWAPIAGHLVVDPLAPLVQAPLDLEGGELVGDDPDPPARAVGPGASVAIGDDLGRRLVLVPLAERAGAGLDERLVLMLEVVGPLGPLDRDDHPAADDRVFAQFRHREVLRGDRPDPVGCLALEGSISRPRRTPSPGFRATRNAKARSRNGKAESPRLGREGGLPVAIRPTQGRPLNSPGLPRRPRRGRSRSTGACGRPRHRPGSPGRRPSRPSGRGTPGAWPSH